MTLLPNARIKPADAMIWVAGGRRDVLVHAPGDRNRYVANGSVIVAVALMAVVSATVTMRLALDLPLAGAMLAGVAWGALILVVDRMLVLGMSRGRGVAGSIGTALSVALRVGLAVVLGVVISTPLVLQVFNSEIDSELQVMKAEAASEFQQQLDTDSRFAGLPALQQTVAAEQKIVDAGPVANVDTDPAVVRARTALAAAQKAQRTAEQAVICEKEGTCGSGRAGAGIAAAEKAQVRDEARASADSAAQDLATAVASARVTSLEQSRNTVASTTAKLATDKANLARLTAEKNALQAQQASVGDSSDGILARLEALHRLGAAHPVMLIAHVFIGLLFLVIELLPVITKLFQLMGPRSLYERLIEAQDEQTLFAATHAIRVRRRVDRLRSRVALATEADLTRRRIDANRAVNAEVVAAQREVTDRTVEAWRGDVRARSIEQIANWQPSRSTRLINLD